MVVKEKIGRNRYILFLIEKEEDIKFLKSENLKLVFLNEKYGIVKCKHTEKEKVIEFLNKKKFKTLKTSGTIRKLKRYIKSISLCKS